MAGSLVSVQAHRINSALSSMRTRLVLVRLAPHPVLEITCSTRQLKTITGACNAEVQRVATRQTKSGYGTQVGRHARIVLSSLLVSPDVQRTQAVSHLGAQTPASGARSLQLGHQQLPAPALQR
jgi:hypothetical protein